MHTGRLCRGGLRIGHRIRGGRDQILASACRDDGVVGARDSGVITGPWSNEQTVPEGGSGNMTCDTGGRGG